MWLKKILCLFFGINESFLYKHLNDSLTCYVPNLKINHACLSLALDHWMILQNLNTMSLDTKKTKGSQTECEKKKNMLRGNTKFNFTSQNFDHTSVNIMNISHLDKRNQSNKLNYQLETNNLSSTKKTEKLFE